MKKTVEIRPGQLWLCSDLGRLIMPLSQVTGPFAHSERWVCMAWTPGENRPLVHVWAWARTCCFLLEDVP